MKIVIAVNELNVVGGIATFSTLLIEQLETLGHHVSLLGITSPIDVKAFPDQTVLFNKTINMQDLSFEQVKINLKHLKFRKAVLQCYDYLRILRIEKSKSYFKKRILIEADVIIALHAHVGFALSHHFANKTIVQFHTDFNTLISNPLEKKYIDYLLQEDIRVGFISKVYEQSAIKYGFNNTFYNYNYVAMPNQVQANTKRIFFYGRFSPEKNLPLWIDIACEILKKSPDVYFEIYGDGPMKQKIQSRIEQKGISEKIKIYGFSNDINLILQKGGVFMLTSDFEGTPMTIIECLYAHIVPAVLDTFGAASELVLKDTSGILEQKDNLDIFIKKICDVLNDPDRYNAYIASSKVLHNNFDSSVISKKWITEINRICELQTPSE